MHETSRHFLDNSFTDLGTSIIHRTGPKSSHVFIPYRLETNIFLGLAFGGNDFLKFEWAIERIRKYTLNVLLI
jgi:hypothetical protein